MNNNLFIFSSPQIFRRVYENPQSLKTANMYLQTLYIHHCIKIRIQNQQFIQFND